MSAQTSASGENSPTPDTLDTLDHHRDRTREQARITEHARDQWTDRICSTQDGYAPWDIDDAFTRSCSVGIPGSRQGRLHDPSGAVFVFTRDWREGPPVVVTTLLESMLHLGDGHLKPCPGCGWRYNAGIRPCPWCDREGEGQ